MKVELSNEERQLLLRLINDVVVSSRFPLSPELERIRGIADKLKGDQKQSPPRGRTPDGR